MFPAADRTTIHKSASPLGRQSFRNASEMVQWQRHIINPLDNNSTNRTNNTKPLSFETLMFSLERNEDHLRAQLTTNHWFWKTQFSDSSLQNNCNFEVDLLTGSHAQESFGIMARACTVFLRWHRDQKSIIGREHFELTPLKWILFS